MLSVACSVTLDGLLVYMYSTTAGCPLVSASRVHVQGAPRVVGPVDS
ncbi:hypothetical protein SAMN05444583_13621 [Rhodococcus maanshanensis]|uniref:Uncharacterized protein n=1 Tax=Rhodococcus maanshanensis TaxID=183556 RepID=A0A1H7Y2L4_9NOCA|nr:hypothetical protein SAMN05444583_13621 [Rhodococcus maanshanensis]